MIGVEGNYLYSFDIAGFNDFIQEEDLIEFTIIESTGNVLPEFELTFSTRNEEIVKFLNEGNLLNVSFGSDNRSLKTTTLIITSKVFVKDANSALSIVLTGVLSVLSYQINSDSYISPKQSGIATIIDRGSPFFNILSNIQKSNDSQRWIKPRLPMKKFIDDVWLHSDLGDGIPAVAIDIEGNMIVKDLKKDFDKDPIFEFVYNNPVKDNQILYLGDMVTDDQTTFINAWLGYDKESIIYNLEEATQEIFNHKPEPIISLTSQIARNSQISTKFGIPSIHNDNVHPNYWKSFIKNITNLASLSSIRTVIKFNKIFSNVRVLDKVLFVDNKILDDSVSSENNSGNYFVTKVSRSINNRQHVTLVEMHRESLNDIKVA